MVKNLQIAVLVIFALEFSGIDSNAQNTKIDTASISIEVILSADTIQKNETLEITVKFRNNQVFPLFLHLGNNLRLSYESGFSDYIKFIDESLNQKIIKLNGYEYFDLKVSIIASDFLLWGGENRFKVFYFDKYDNTRYFAFSQPLIVFYKY